MVRHGLAPRSTFAAGTRRRRVIVDELGPDVRVLADVLCALFERDRQFAVALNAAQRRLLAANERLTVAMPVGAVLCAMLDPSDVNLGVVRRRPPVLEAESPVAALGEVADVIRSAMGAYQDADEQRRQVAADIGEATVRLVDGLIASGFSDAQARRADVWALRDGVHRAG
jgi:hypothetical protein